MDDTEINPHGTVECAGCDELGRPAGGITYQRRDQRIHQSYQLPEGWALVDLELLCGACAAAAAAPRARQKRSKAPPLAPAVEGRHSGPSAPGACWPFQGEDAAKPIPVRSRVSAK